MIPSLFSSFLSIYLIHAIVTGITLNIQIKENTNADDRGKLFAITPMMRRDTIPKTRASKLTIDKTVFELLLFFKCLKNSESNWLIGTEKKLWNIVNITIGSHYPFIKISVSIDIAAKIVTNKVIFIGLYLVNRVFIKYLLKRYFINE